MDDPGRWLRGNKSLRIVPQNRPSETSLRNIPQNQGSIGKKRCCKALDLFFLHSGGGTDPKSAVGMGSQEWMDPGGAMLTSPQDEALGLQEHGRLVRIGSEEIQAQHRDPRPRVRMGAHALEFLRLFPFS